MKLFNKANIIGCWIYVLCLLMAKVSFGEIDHCHKIWNTQVSNDSLHEMGMIVSAFYDEERCIFSLIGDGEHTDCSPTLQQIATAFQCAYADSPRTAYLSIDPWPDNPHYPWMKVRMSPNLWHTDFGWIMFETDRLLKCYALGEDNITGQKMTSSVPDFMNVLQISLENKKSAKNEVWSRFWLYPKDNIVEANEKCIRIRKAVIGVKTEKMILQGNKLVSVENVRDPAAEQFATFFTEHYSEFIDERPIYRKLEQLMRLLIISDWMRHQYLFEIDEKFKTYLDRNKLPLICKEQFNKHNIKISENLKIDVIKKGEYWKTRNQDDDFQVSIRYSDKYKKLQVFKDRKIPLNLNWVDKYKSQNYRMASITPALQVSLTDTQYFGNSIHYQTIQLFGGVDLDVQPNYQELNPEFNEWILQFTNAVRNSTKNPFHFQSQNQKYRGFLSPLSKSNMKPVQSKVIAELDLPDANKMTLKVQEVKTDLGIHWQPALPRLYSFCPEGRDGFYQTTGIRDKPESLVTLREYQLYDDDGKCLGCFSEHDIDQIDVRMVINPVNPDNRWQLHPVKNQMVWAVDNNVLSVEEKNLAFDINTGLLIGRQINNELIHYQYNQHGYLTRIENNDKTKWIDLKYGYNGTVLTEINTSDGQSSILHPAPLEKEIHFTLIDEFNQRNKIQIDMEGNWTTNSEMSSSSSIKKRTQDFINAFKTSAEDIISPKVIYDGSYTYMIVKDIIKELPIDINEFERITYNSYANPLLNQPFIDRCFKDISEPIQSSDNVLIENKKYKLRKAIAGILSTLCENPVFTTSNSSRGRQNIKKINQKTERSKIQTIVIEESMSDALKTVFKKEIKQDNKRDDNADIVVVIAHNTIKLKEQLTDIGDYLNGKELILLRCGEADNVFSSESISEMLLENLNATCILSPNFIIDAGLTQQIVNKMNESIKSSKEPTSGWELFKRSIERVIDGFKQNNEKDEKLKKLEKMKDFQLEVFYWSETFDRWV